MEKKRYSIKCPYCGRKQCCSKSIFHLMGIYDFGSGNCLSCNKLMQIIYDPKTDAMKTREWEKFMEENVATI